MKIEKELKLNRTFIELKFKFFYKIVIRIEIISQSSFYLLVRYSSLNNLLLPPFL